MTNKIINGLGIACLLAAIIGAFCAVYLRHIPEQIQPPLPEKTSTSVPAAAPQLPPFLRVGILGASRSDGRGKYAFNKKVLLKLFKVLKEQNVQAVFVTGDLIYGWQKTTPNALDSYNSEAFKEQLLQFDKLFKTVFGDTAELYPLMGTHEAIGPDAAKKFREVFDIPDTIPPNNEFIAYSVSMGNAFFAMFPTDFYLEGSEQSIPPAAFPWLNNTLANAVHDHRFLFVMGHQPAFTTPSLLSRSHGLAEDQQQRNALWAILKKNNVLAYFASSEHLYDRTNRYGIWQVISGGGGALLYEHQKLSANAFFHCLVLTLPQNNKGTPSVQVFDTDGKIRDEFELKSNPEQQPLYQMRISSLFI